MTLSRALGGTMILLPTASNLPVNSVHLSFSNEGLASSVPEPCGQANRAVQSVSLWPGVDDNLSVVRFGQLKLDPWTSVPSDGLSLGVWEQLRASWQWQWTESISMAVILPSLVCYLAVIHTKQQCPLLKSCGGHHWGGLGRAQKMYQGSMIRHDGE